MRKELQRDEGLLRLSRGTRWLAAGAVAGAGLMSIAVAESLPGRSSAATTPRTTPTTTPPTSASTASGASEEQSEPSEGGDDGVAATPQTAPATAPPTFTVPTAPPQTAYNPPVVSSGGS